MRGDPRELSCGYAIAAIVNGEILIAAETLAVSVTGVWRHEWGALAWPDPPVPLPRGLRAPLRVDKRTARPLLIERVLDEDGWHEWLRSEPAP